MCAEWHCVLPSSSSPPPPPLPSPPLPSIHHGIVSSSAVEGEVCRRHKVFLHTDAAQAVGKVGVDVNDLNIDLMSISGHKLYGPKGDEYE